MEPAVLLAQLRALFERAPDFDQYSPTSREHLIWLGQAHALLVRWDQMAAIEFKIASDNLHIELTRAGQVAKILATLQRAISDLEINVPAEQQGIFAGGEVYDFFRELNKVIASAETSLYIIDPYLDETVFDHYLNSRAEGVSVRLLLNRNAEKVGPGAEKYVQQFGPVLEVKKSEVIHDRVIFVDGYVCWVVGQSIKDAAKAKPTYLVPLSPDIVPRKLADYERIWNDADAI